MAVWQGHLGRASSPRPEARRTKLSTIASARIDNTAILPARHIAACYSPPTKQTTYTLIHTLLPIYTSTNALYKRAASA